MDFSITYQESYSRGELLLRSFFGWLYIMAPHAIVLMFVGLWSNVLSFISWWAILFTGRYPQSFFEFNVKTLSWMMRLNACSGNLIEGYPAIGPNGSHPAVTLTVPYPESLSRGKLLLRTFLGFIYVGIPHGICLYGRLIANAFAKFLTFWSIIFNGTIPRDWFDFQVGTLRWMVRLNLYMSNMSDTYPPFSGKPDAVA